MPEITTEKRGAAIVIAFNRPDRANALTSDMATQLFNVLKPVTTDRGIRAVLLKGMGGNFMDGLDMALYGGDFNAALERANQMFQPYHSAIRELQTMDKPVLAAIDGTVSGQGLSLMLACDLAIAGRGAKFNGRYGSGALTPDGDGSFALARRVGAARACEILTVGETFGAAEAERWNLVNAVVDDAKLHEEALAWLDRLANGPTRVYGGIKKLVAKAFEQDSNAHLALEHSYWGATVRSFDFREVIRAQAAKRPVKFTGS